MDRIIDNPMSWMTISLVGTRFVSEVTCFVVYFKPFKALLLGLVGGSFIFTPHGWGFLLVVCCCDHLDLCVAVVVAQSLYVLLID